MIFESERLFARPYTLDDVDDAFAMYGDAEMMRHLMGAQVVPDLAAQRVWLAERIARYQAMAPGFGAWALEDKASGRVIGTALLKAAPTAPTGPERSEGVRAERARLAQRETADDLPGDDLEIGWHVVRRLWGHGYARETGRALLSYGFGPLGVKRLIALVEPPNTRSLAVATRIGMTALGTTTRYYGGSELMLFEALLPTSPA